MTQEVEREHNHSNTFHSYGFQVKKTVSGQAETTDILSS